MFVWNNLATTFGSLFASASNTSTAEIFSLIIFTFFFTNEIDSVIDTDSLLILDFACPNAFSI